MLLINLHAIPESTSEYFGKVIGAYVSVYVDYVDAEGAIQLAKFYTEDEGWKVENIEDEFFEIENAAELDEEQKQFFEEAEEYGYTMIFNCYESEDEGEEE